MTPRERYTFDIKAAAEYLGLAVSTLYGIAERQEIDHLRTRGNVATCVRRGKTVRVSGRLKFSEAGLDAWIASNRSPVRRLSHSTPSATSKADSLPMPATRRFTR